MIIYNQKIHSLYNIFIYTHTFLFSITWAGKSTRYSAPRPGWLITENVPPCDRTLDEIFSRPIPTFFVPIRNPRPSSRSLITTLP